MQLVNPPHEREVDCRPGQVIDAPPTDGQRRRLPHDRQIVRTVDHRFALGKAGLLSALSKKSFSGSDFTLTAGCAPPLPPPGPNTSAAPSSSCAFHDVI
jgi:hypothetical protein